MPKKNKQTLNNNGLKIVILTLVFTMIAGLFYMYNMTDRSKNAIIELREQKSNILADLEKSQLFLDQILTSNKSLSKKLALEQAKVKKLIFNLKKKSVTEKSILIHKKDANDIDNSIKSLLNEINLYKKKIDSTNIALSSTKIVLKKEKTKNDTLTISNKKLVKKIAAASKLYFYNLQTTSFKIKGSGKQTETDNADKIDLIKISFMIAENDLVKPTSKDFFIQIIDSKNNVLGSKKIEKFGNETLTFSTSSNVKYKNKTIKVDSEIPVSNLEEGAYFVNVFDKNKLVLKSDFTLN